MKLRIERDVFAEAVTWTARTIPTRPSLPILSGIKIEALEDGQLALSSYDPDISAHAVIEAAVDQPGEILVSGRLLADYLRALPNKPVALETQGAKLDLTCGASRMSMTSMPLEDYPDAPELEGTSGTINGAAWQQAVSQAVTAASTDDTLPLLVSVCIEIHGSDISLMATDRYRLAVAKVNWEPADPEIEARILVRASRLSDIARSLGTAGDVTMTIDNSGRTGAIGFAAAGRKSIARLIDGDYPQVLALFPDEVAGYAVINRAEMLDAIKRARLVVEKNAAVRLEFSEGQVVLDAGQNDNAQTSEALQVALYGEPITMAFNPSFLQDGLSALTTDYLRLSYTHPTKPAVLTGQAEPEGEDSQDFRLLLMPIRTYSA
ncbi:DNA polymerase III subunit beta [Actinobaculum suis]|uniref:DNA polymerase III subunit beta n=1 Tax=Actinobaculum suis TaxID=1657 RepID=UPI00066FBFE1|nr:DNA polymerase III subunit beta [Actinobaculum suis]KMY23182.1 DNA polymerase III subunit beta [Actinobaculum suis]